MFLATVVAATLAGSAAEAAVSVTINFPATGDGWCGTDNGVSTCGTLSNGGFTGKMQKTDDSVTSSLSNADGYPFPRDFVATGLSGFLRMGGSTAYTVLQVGPYSGDTVVLSNYAGSAVPFSFTFAPTSFSPGDPWSVVLLTDVPQTNPSVGNWLQIGPGSLTFTGSIVPEPSTWAMMVMGFVGLGFAGYRASRKGAAIGV
jgi:hypothetical protein